ncbi:MAG: DUF2341 domain-containing protein, partial [Ferruginibacter sp.]
MKKFYTPDFTRKFSLKVYFLIASFIFLSVATLAQGPGPSWQYFKPITLSTPTTLADYQVKVTLNAGQYANINADGSDLRFYDNANNVCSYWIENFNTSGKSTIWVKIPTVGSNLLMYYGNPAATPVSNGSNTFDFFDDFNTALAGNWSKNTAGGTITQSGTEVTLLTTQSGDVSISTEFNTASPTFFLETKHKEGAYYRNRFYATTSLNGNSPVGFDYGLFNNGFGATAQIFWNGFQANTVTANTDYLTQWQITDGSTYIWNNFNYATGALVDNRSTTYGPNIRFINYMINETNGISTIIDWLRVRKSQTTDPISTLGVEVHCSVNAGLDIDICQDNPATLSGTYSGTATGAVWSTPAGGTFSPNANTLNATWTPPIGFNSSATLTLTASGGACGVMSDATVVTSNLPPSGNLTPSTLSSCAGSDVTFAAPFGYADYNFTINGSSKQSGNSNSFLTSALKNGDVVEVIITNKGCSVTLKAPAVTINAYPTGTFDATEASGLVANDNIICQGAQVSFSFDPGFINYKFILNGSIILQNNATSFVNTNSLNNNDYVTVEVTGAGGCTKTFGPITIQVKDLPTGNLDVHETSGTVDDNKICIGENVKFTAPAGYTSYDFKVNGVSVVNPSNIYNTTTLNDGDQVSVIVTNSNGCTLTLGPVTITVYPLPAAPTISGVPTEFCVGGSVLLTSSVATTYQWYKDGVAIGGAISQTYNATTGGNYTVKITNANTCGSESLPTSVTVNTPPPIPTIGASGLIAFCDGGSVTLTSSSLDATGYQWNKDGIPMVGVTNQTYTATTSGDYTVTVTNAKGCQSTSLKTTVTVHPLPGIPTITAGGSTTFCSGVNVTLTSSYATSFQWYQNGTLITGATSQSYVATTTGNYTVTVGDGFQCKATSLPISVTANPLPEPTLNGPNPICPGSTGTYITEPGFSNYAWSYSGGTLAGGGGNTDASITITWDKPGPKTVFVNYENSFGCSASKSKTVTTSTNPLPTVTASQSDDVCIYYSGNIYTTESTAGNKDFEWTIVGGTIDLGQGTASVSVTWNIAGPQSISVNYSNVDGCTAASPTVHNVNVHPLPIGKFNYINDDSPDGNYCANGSNPFPAMSMGAVKGTFSSTAGLIFISTTTGQVNLLTSAPGTYKVYNTIAPALGCNVVIDSAYITVTATPTAVLSYASPFCKDISIPQSVTLTGTNDYTGGTFSSQPAGLTINTTSGEITPSSSTAGSYTVKYLIPGKNGCTGLIATTSVTITALPTSTISYAGSPFCTSLNGAQSVTLGGSGAYTGGGYSASPGGLSINSSTGAITPSTSTPGNYVVTYSTPIGGGCGITTSTASVTITAMPTATISYVGTPFCSSSTSQLVTLGGTGVYTPGTFSSDMNLSINSATGEINPSASTLGLHTVSYLITPSGGCTAAVVTTPINITAAAISFAGADFSTCAAIGAINIPAGSSNSATVTWTSSGTGTFTNANSLTNATYTPSVADTTAGSVILTLTATGTNNCGNVSSSKKLTFNSNPSEVFITPTSGIFCVGTLQPLTSTKTSTTGVITNTVNPNTAIPDNNFFGISTAINMANLPAGAIVDSINVSVKITHDRTKDLYINLKAPNNKVLNLANGVGSGSNFITPTFSSASSHPIQTFGTNPYNDYFAPMAQPGVPGAAVLAGGTQFGPATFSDLFSVIGGNWYVSVRDGIKDIPGTLNSVNINVYYSIPASPVPLTWSPATELYTDAAGTNPYDGTTPLSTVYAKLTTPGNKAITGTATSLLGCTTALVANLTVKPSPTVSIDANYCSSPGRVILTAISPDAISYNWSDSGKTTQAITIDIANNYFVSVTNSYGCVATAISAVAQELVVNGDFTQGNIGFTSGYTYYADDPMRNDELVPDDGTNGYGVGINGQNYHSYFFGIDHTNNQTGPRNFMLVNGHDGIVTWKQTVFVKANTDYYFSGWAMSINDAGPFAQLQFKVDGVLVGTTAVLGPGPHTVDEANANNYWTRFYSNPLWHNSGADRSIEIEIVDLEGSHGGNDFALDDISFATLSPFVTPPADGSDNQTICEGETIKPIKFLVGSGSTGPELIVSPAAPEITASWDGRTFTVSGTPLAAGTYNYTVTTGGSCPNPKAASGTIVVNPKAIITLGSFGSDIQERCINTNIAPINYTFGGGGTGVAFNGLPAGINGTYNAVAKTASISGSTSLAGTYNYTITTTGTCAQKSLGGVITISDASIGGSITQPTICLGDNGTLTLSGRLGKVVKWQVSNDKITYLDVANTDTFLVSPPITQSTFYRAVLQNGSCPNAYSDGGKLRIKNLWEGQIDNTWISQNWSAGILPDNSCSNTVTIPKVIPGYHDPILTSVKPVTNLNILTGGNLTISGGTLQVGGAITNAGVLDATAGTLEFNGNSQTTNGSIFKNNTIQNVIVSSTGASTLSVGGISTDTLKITGTLSFGNTTAKINSGDHITLVSTNDATANVGVVNPGNTISGKFTVERFIPALRSWRFMAVNTQLGQTIHQAWQENEGTNVTNGIKNRGISIPGEMSNFAALGFDIKSAAPAMKWYDPATDKYVGITSTNIPFDATKGGYLTFIRGDRSANATNSPVTATTLRTTGKLFTGTMLNISVQPGKFMPVNNPYAASIDLRKIMQSSSHKDEIQFYVYDPRLGANYGYGGFHVLVWDNTNNTYFTVPVSGSYAAPINSNPNLIQSGQAFWVSSTSITENLPLDESRKSVGSTGGMMFRPQGPDEGIKNVQLGTTLFINNADHIIVDGTLQQFSKDYSNNLDGMDAKKLANPAENLSIKNANKLLVVERRSPFMTQDTVFYNMTGMRAQNYQFQFDAQGLSTFGTEGWVEDSYLHTKTPLSLEGMTTVAFSVTNVAGTYAADRFRIVFQAAAGPLPVTIVSVKATQKDADVAVEWKVDNQSNMKEYQVEKSLDGNRFNNVGTISANTNNASVYNFLDKNAPAGYNFYRIRSIGKDGQQTVTQIVRVLIQ